MICKLTMKVVTMEYLVKISKKTRILELKRRNMKITDSDNQYAVSIKENTVYPCLHFTKDHEGNTIQCAETVLFGVLNERYEILASPTQGQRVGKESANKAIGFIQKMVSESLKKGEDVNGRSYQQHNVLATVLTVRDNLSQFVNISSYCIDAAKSFGNLDLEDQSVHLLRAKDEGEKDDVVTIRQERLCTGMHEYRDGSIEEDEATGVRESSGEVT
ncbi:hypothetical protein Tco_1002291 [Tanacetum coccineum]|uniref:Uncharacterized protein n=1 Tax=Tanacetum coccineum TaxID=301880 RepID=A0ABQ5F7B4_9ASTR